MHTATQVRAEMFTAAVDGHPVSPSDLLQWSANDRFGIVVNQPYGALGAGLLVLLAVASFYDTPGKGRRTRPVYPEILLFHVGGPWGSHSSFDFWPEGKEVFVPADPVEALRAINRHGITHLAVPDGPGRDVMHRNKEPESAIDRISHAYAYDPTGTTANADLLLSSTDSGLRSIYETTLVPESYLTRMEESVRTDPALQLETPEARDYRRLIAYVRERWSEVDRGDPFYRAAAQRVSDVAAAGRIVETIRKLPVEAALRMLG